jgi:oxidoreductase
MSADTKQQTKEKMHGFVDNAADTAESMGKDMNDTAESMGKDINNAAESVGKGINNLISKKLRAFVVGSTGQVGSEIVKELAKNEGIGKVTMIVRHTTECGLKKCGTEPGMDCTKIEQKHVNFDKLSESRDAFKGHDVGFCALGTTRSKEGKEGLHRVDHDYVVEAAKLAKEGGCKHFNLITAQGADESSMIEYTKVKGQAEEDVKAIGFKRLSIFRPGLLIVDREESRPLETMAQNFAKVVDFTHSASIPVPLLAKVMVQQCFEPTKVSGNENRLESIVELFDNKTIYNLAKEKEQKQQ